MNLIEFSIKNHVFDKYKSYDLYSISNGKLLNETSFIKINLNNYHYKNNVDITLRSLFDIKNSPSNVATVFLKKELCLLDHLKGSGQKVKTDTHKRLTISRYVVPRECYIRRQLDRFMQQMLPVVRGYNGMSPASAAPVSERIATYKAVLPLPIVGGAVPDMKNGHITDVDQHGVRRCLTVQDRQAGIVGAIYFRINLATRVCYVDCLGVSRAHHKKHFGQTLLQCAIVIARVYACKKVELSSVLSAIAFYKGQGFMQTACYCEFDFQNVVSLDRFAAKSRDTAPHFSLQSLACEVEAKRKEAHLSLS